MAPTSSGSAITRLDRAAFGAQRLHPIGAAVGRESTVTRLPRRTRATVTGSWMFTWVEASSTGTLPCSVRTSNCRAGPLGKAGMYSIITRAATASLESRSIRPILRLPLVVCTGSASMSICRRKSPETSRQ